MGQNSHFRSLQSRSSCMLCFMFRPVTGIVSASDKVCITVSGSKSHLSPYYIARELNTPTITRWTVGSVMFLSSFAAMMGPMAYARHLISGPRLPFTAAYFGAIGLTLFFAVCF